MVFALLPFQALTPPSPPTPVLSLTAPITLQHPAVLLTNWPSGGGPAADPQPQFSRSSNAAIELAQTVIPNPNGSGTIVTPKGDRLDITGGQLSGDGTNLFHSFQEFGLTADQIANFISSPDIQNILGGVNGGNASIINGLLQVSGGNANLYLINPAGIVFGADATLNLRGSFTATTADQLGFGDAWLDILNPEEYQALTGSPDGFAFSTDQPGAILNLGNLAVDAGQDVSLIGGEVANLGTLAAPAGNITLLAVPGENLVRISQENMLLSLEIAPSVTPAGQLQFDPLALPELLTGTSLPDDNLTVVQMPDGTVQLQSASITAPVELGSVLASGTITTEGQQGGQIYLLGQQVAVLDAEVNASGELGGGSVYLGGDFQGEGELPNALVTMVDEGSRLSADAQTSGDGGTIIVWADDTTQFLGEASVTGAGVSGSGGFVEISGLHTLQFDGEVDASAPSGKVGTLLLDPTNIEIVPDGKQDTDFLTDVDKFGDPDLGANNTTRISVEVINQATANIILQATNNITFSTDVAIAPFGIGLAAQANNNILLNSNITTAGGSVTLAADVDGNGSGSVISAAGTTIKTGNFTTPFQGGDVTISGAGLQLGSINTSSVDPGQVLLNSTGNIAFDAIDTTSISVNQGADISILANGTVQGFGTGITINADTPLAGKVTIQHDGGPNNVPFQVGNNGAAVNGTNGAIAGDITVSDQAFPTLASNGNTNPSPNITITSLNTAPTLAATSQLATTVNQALTFAVADLNPTVTDVNNDTTTLAIASIAAGTLLRNGVAVQVGDAIAPTDTLQFIPPNNTTGVITAFTLRAQDGVSTSAAVPITVTVSQATTRPPETPDPSPPERFTVPLDPTLGTTRPPVLPAPLYTETTVLQGFPLAQSAVVEDLAILGMVLPEPNWLVFDAFDFGPNEIVPFIFNGGANLPDIGLAGEVNTTTLYSIFQPDAPVDVADPAAGFPDIADPTVPPGTDDSAAPGTAIPDPATPDIAAMPAAEPETGVAATRSATRQGFQNCQAVVKEVQDQTPRGRTEPVYTSLINCYEQSLAIATEQGEEQWIAYTLNNLATSYFVVGDYLRSLELYEQQLEQARGLNNPTLEGIALGGIGSAYAALGDYPRAIDFYEQSLAVMPLETAPQWKALVFRNLGNANFAEKDYSQAAAYQRSSLDISRGIGDVYGEMQAQGNLGGTLAIQGDFVGAIAAYEQALTLAQSLNNGLEIGQTFLGLSAVYAYQQNYDQAYRYSRQALAIARELGASLGEGIALTNLGNALLYLERLPEAEQALFEAIRLWETLRAGLGTNDNFKVSIFETQLAAYLNLQEVLVTQNKVAPALEISERGRARAFIELLARGAVNPNQAGAIAPPDLAQMQQIARAENATLVEYTIIRDQVVDTPHAVSPQNPIEPRDTQLYIWVVQPSGNVQLRQVDLREAQHSDSVEALVAETRVALTGRDDITLLAAGRGIGVVADDPSDRPNPAGDSEAPPLQQLHALLIEPIADLLPTDPNAPVIFVPQEHLFLVPFAALQSADGTYLVERHTPVITPSIQALDLVSQSRDGATSTLENALVVGNPSPMPGSYAPLPNAELEANTIADLLSTSALVRSAATESQVKAQLATASMIHLATHGEFDESQPMQGAVALAPGGGDDGLLTAAEILSLPIRADLVVLSACDTGRGRITGDGVIGLARSFIAAGAPKVVVSLWQVPDAQTAELMVAFHQQRLAGVENAQALRQAMLSMLATNPDPAVWAAFVQIGTTATP